MLSSELPSGVPAELTLLHPAKNGGTFTPAGETGTHLLAIQSVEPPHGSRVQLDGLCDVGQHLLKGVRRLLIEQHSHCLAGLDATADDRDQLGFDEVFGLTLQLAFQREEGGEGAGCARPAAHQPVRVDVLGVVHPPERLVRGAHVALTWRKKQVEVEKFKSNTASTKIAQQPRVNIPQLRQKGIFRGQANIVLSPFQLSELLHWPSSKATHFFYPPTFHLNS